MPGEDLGFGGEVAGFYHEYRRGYSRGRDEDMVSSRPTLRLCH